MATESRFRLWPARSETSAPTLRQAPPMQQPDGNVVETHAFNTKISSSYSIVFSENELRGAPYSTGKITDMAKNPMRHIKELREWSSWAYYSNGTISTAIDGLASMHALDYFVIAKAKKNSNNSKQKNAVVRNMNKVLSSIRIKEVIRNAVFCDAKDGMYVGYLEVRNHIPSNKQTFTDYELDGMVEINDRNSNISIVSLPIDYVRIIGRRNSCYEAAFDLRYFDGMTEDQRKLALREMPKQIQNGWERYHSGAFADGATWLRLDWKRTIIHKIKSDDLDPFGIPFAVAALDDIEYAKYFTNTKRNVLDNVNNQIYYETFPEGKDKGTSALTQKQQKEQHDNVKSAITTKKHKSGVSFFSLAAGTKMDRLPVDISLLDEENENAIKEDVNKGIGFSGAALHGSSSGNYATASLNLELIAANVYSWIEAIVKELNKCLNYNVIKDGAFVAECFVLPTTFLNREKYAKQFADLYARGKGSLIAWIAATGVNADDYISLMDYELENDFENKYPVHKTSFTVTGKDAPEYEDVDDNNGGSEGNPSTESTVANNGNASPSPSDQ